jgi:hypothetical protein
MLFRVLGARLRQRPNSLAKTKLIPGRTRNRTLLETCRARADELELSRLEIDRLGGLPTGYAGKLLGKDGGASGRKHKKMWPVALESMLGVGHPRTAPRLLNHSPTHLFSKSFFKLPFVTLPQDPGDDWGEFWERVDM